MREEWLDYGRFGLAVLGPLITYLWGGWDIVLQVLVLFVVFDYMTGLMAAWTRKDLSSEIGAKGIAKKVGIFVIVAVCHLLDQSMALDAPFLRTAAIWFYIANEALSIVENIGDSGGPIPPQLKEALERLKNKGIGG